MNEMKQLLINSKSFLDFDEQNMIIDNLFDVFISYGKDVLYIFDGKINRIKDKKAFETIAYLHVVSILKINPKKYNAESKTTEWGIGINMIYDVIASLNAYDILRYESDIFAKKQRVSKDEKRKIITVITNKIHIKCVNTEMNKEEYEEIIRDYKKHFPKFDELINLILDMRLAKNRKASFLHLRVRSNWGKSFLSALFKNIEIGIEIDYHHLVNKATSDISPVQVRNTFVMLLDEFNNFSSEMKKLSHSFGFAPKFGMREEVELYLKILMSAEKSSSFVGGVDAQIINRVMVFDLRDGDTVELTDRAIYRKYGNAQYMDALEEYVSRNLILRLEEYLDMEKYKAHKLADERVLKSLALYKIDSAKDIYKEMREMINSYILELLDEDDVMAMSSRDREVKSNLIKIERGGRKGCVFIKKPKRTIEAILKGATSDDEYKKMRWKLSDLEQVLDIESDRPVLIDGKTMRGLTVRTTDDMIELEVEDNGSIEKKYIKVIVGGAEIF